MTPKLAIGRIVQYTLTRDDAIQVNRRRVDGAGHNWDWPKGAQAHVGEQVSEGEILPMIVVGHGTMHTNPDLKTGENSRVVPIISGQVILPGNDSLWLTFVPWGEGPGTWHWPVELL